MLIACRVICPNVFAALGFSNQNVSRDMPPNPTTEGNEDGMTRKEQPEPGTLKSLFAPYIDIATIVGTILVVLGVAAALGIVYLRRKFKHALIAYRADKQDRQYIRGDERGTYGKYRPERLDR